MKTIKYLNLLPVVIIFLMMSSCVKDGTYGIPEISIVAPDLSPLGTKTTFNAVISRYLDAMADGDAVGVFSTEFDDPLYIAAYVISSDRAGNFFEELIVQNTIDDNDAGTDPRRGLLVKVNVGSLSDTYEVGRKIYIKLNGLAIGMENGIYILGSAEGNRLEQIQSYEYTDHILRDPEVAILTPKIVTIEDLRAADLSTLIQLEEVQINRNQLDMTFAGEASDEFDGFRTLESCASNATLLLQTSTFADFKSAQLPQNRGAIQGIFTRDFGDNFNVLVINSLTDVHFENPERCDPVELDCGLAQGSGLTTIFSDDFETQTPNALIGGNGWTNFIEEGTVGWEAYSAEGTNASLGISSTIGSYNSGDVQSVAWLVTPAINFEAQNNETLEFKTSNSFADGSLLEVLFSADWDGVPANIPSATWGVLPAAYIVQDGDFFGNWFDSGSVDLSCAEGTLHIAFRYTGSGREAFDGSYELDEVRIAYTP